MCKMSIFIILSLSLRNLSAHLSVCVCFFYSFNLLWEQWTPRGCLILSPHMCPCVHDRVCEWSGIHVLSCDTFPGLEALKIDVFVFTLQGCCGKSESDTWFFKDQAVVFYFCSVVKKLHCVVCQKLSSCHYSINPRCSCSTCFCKLHVLLFNESLY